MAVAVLMHLTDVNPGAYDRAIASLELDASPPIGCVLHLVAQGEDGLQICDVWQTREAAESFVATRLGPALADAGIHSASAPRVLPLHNLFAPDLDTIERIGALSLPAGRMVGTRSW